MEIDDEMIEIYNEITGLEAVIASIGEYPCDPEAFRALGENKQALKKARALYEAHKTQKRQGGKP